MKTTVYSTKVCPYCVQAKGLLKAKGIEFNEITVNKVASREALSSNEITRDDFIALMKETCGEEKTSVPQIFLEGQYIGGFTDLVAHYNKIRDEELEKTLVDIVVG